MKFKIKEMVWFMGGAFVGFTALTIASASVPKRSAITNDTVLHQNLSEIRVRRTAALSADPEIARLASLERNYQNGLIPKAARSSRTKSRSKHQSLLDDELDRLD